MMAIIAYSIKKINDMANNYNEHFDVFVSYYQMLAKDFAESIHEILTKNYKLKVYVNHLYQNVNQGEFRNIIDKIIKNCKIFILINSKYALSRSEIVREIKVAFPNGNVTKHDFWIFRQKNTKVPLSTKEFNKETNIDLSKQNQPEFSTSEELKRIVDEVCEYNLNKTEKNKSLPNSTPLFIYNKINISKEYINDFNKQSILDSYQKAENLLNERDFINALKTFDEILDISHDDFNAIIRKGIVLVILKRYQESEEQFSNAIFLRKNAPEPWANKAISRYYQNKFDDALYHIKKAISLSVQKDKVLFFNEGIILFKLQNYVESIKSFNNALSIDSAYSEAISSKAASLITLGCKEESFNLLHKALEHNPNNYNAYYNLGVIYEEDKKYPQALLHYNRSIELNANYYFSYINKARVLRIQNRVEEALKTYETAINKNPDNVELYYNKGTYLGKLHRFEESLSYFDTALQIEPNWIPTKINKAESLYQLKRYDEAINLVNDVLKVEKQNLFALKIAGWSHFEKSEMSLARQKLLKVFELEPSIETLRVLNQIYTKEPNYDEMLQFLNKSLNIYSNDIESLLLRSHVNIKLGRYSESINDCDSVIKLDKEQATAYYNEGCAKTFLKKESEAIQLIKKAISLNTLLKDYAKDDNDLLPLRNHPDFKNLIK
jgi:tetratricopeptide (TPR) repeat protein